MGKIVGGNGNEAEEFLSCRKGVEWRAIQVPITVKKNPYDFLGE